jgi:nucleoid DNA-binding protein
MKLPGSKLDIVSMAAEEAGISRNKMLFIIRDFEKQLRSKLSSPGTTGKLITITSFCNFTLNEWKIREREKRLKENITEKDKEVLNLLNKEYEG